MIEHDRADSEESLWPRGLSIFSTGEQGRTDASLLPFLEPPVFLCLDYPRTVG